MYLGNTPALSYTSFAKQDFTTSATTSYTLDNPVTNANELALFINFVRQEPTTAYSASGTTLTLTSATSATDDMYCVFLGKAVQTVNPPSGSVGISQLSATGTKDATTFLRGDNTFAVAGGTNTPAFAVNIDAHQTLSNATDTVIAFNQETVDTDAAFNLSTYRFTPQVAGKYAIYLTMVAFADGDSRLETTFCQIRKNGAAINDATGAAEVNSAANNGRKMAVNSHAIVTLNGSSDYVDFNCFVSVTAGVVKLHIDQTAAMGFKLTE